MGVYGFSLGRLAHMRAGEPRRALLY
jgi:hypothetical protein